jgi:hypothetical protein
MVAKALKSKEDQASCLIAASAALTMIYTLL